jgi:alkylation response protein AidB-like acyl-CoA dehydrogenase
MVGLEFAHACLNDFINYLKQRRFDKHLDKLEQVLTRLSEAGLKINAVKSFFARTNLRIQHQ